MRLMDSAVISDTRNFVRLRTVSGLRLAGPEDSSLRASVTVPLLVLTISSVALTEIKMGPNTESLHR